VRRYTSQPGAEHREGSGEGRLTGISSDSPAQSQEITDDPIDANSFSNSAVRSARRTLSASSSAFRAHLAGSAGWDLEGLDPPVDPVFIADDHPHGPSITWKRSDWLGWR
jgi:hypothetical protein